MDVQSVELREMQEKLKDEGDKLRDSDINIEAVNSMFMNQQPLLERQRSRLEIA